MKYSILLNEKKVCPNGSYVYRIVAEKDIFTNKGLKIVSKGQKGGFVSSERSLSQSGSCWIFDDAMVSDFAHIKDSALIYDDVLIGDFALIKDYARVSNNVKITNSAQIEGNAVVSGNAIIKNCAIVRDHATVRGDAVIKDYATICDFGFVTDNATIENLAVISGNVFGNAVVKDNAIVRNCGKVSKNSVVGGNFVVNSNVSISMDKDKLVIGPNVYNNKSYCCSAPNKCACKIHEHNFFNLFIVPIFDIGCFTYLRDHRDSAAIFISKDFAKTFGLSSKKSFKNKEELWDYIYSFLNKRSIKTGVEKYFYDYLINTCYNSLCRDTQLLANNFLSELLNVVNNKSNNESAKNLIKEKSELIVLRAENYFFGCFIGLIFYLLNLSNNKDATRGQEFLNKMLESGDIDISQNRIVSFSTTKLFNDELLRMVENTCNFHYDCLVGLDYKNSDFIRIEL